MMQFECGTRILRVIHGRDARGSISGAGGQTLDCAKNELLSTSSIVRTRLALGERSEVVEHVIPDMVGDPTKNDHGADSSHGCQLCPL